MSSRLSKYFAWTKQVTDDKHESTESRSRGQRTRDGAIVLLDFASIISDASDLLKPLKVVCGALKKSLEIARNVEDVNSDWKQLTEMLKFQLATLVNQSAKLEEDRHIDGISLPLNPAITKALMTYANELRTIYQLLWDNRPKLFSFAKQAADVERNRGMIRKGTWHTDVAFQVYTRALHLFVAKVVDEMQQELKELHQEFLQEAKKTHLNRLQNSNAYGVQHVPCLQGTRQKTLDAIRHWVDDEGSPRWIFCLLDVAGSGKSTVAKHMAEEWYHEQRMVARFFFSRDTAETMSTKYFCSTVGNAFADRDSQFKAHMSKYMARPNWELQSFEEQFRGLVAGPLKALGRHAILTIDALDECNNEHGSRNQLLDTLRDQLSSVPMLRLLITGRPERDIKAWAVEKMGISYHNFFQLEGDDKDVEIYIRSRLQALPPNVQGLLYPVIRHAEGLFIWARIACDLLLATADIDGLLDVLGREVSLDYLYKIALEQSMPKDKASHRAMLVVLQMILAARTPLSIAQLERLSPRCNIVEPIIARLGSLLQYQSHEDPIRLLHTTFREFLTARPKAGIYFIQPELGHYTLALSCLDILSHQLEQEEGSLASGDSITFTEWKVFWFP